MSNLSVQPYLIPTVIVHDAESTRYNYIFAYIRNFPDYFGSVNVVTVSTL